MKFRVLASDSLGVRSMATFVQTRDAKIIIDPSAALGPRRYGLPPSDLEYQALDLSQKTIRKYFDQSDVVIITHYHWDHYDPSLPFQGKMLFVKDPENNINRSQRERAKLLRADYETADGRRIEIGNTEIKFSPALPHGPDGTKLGYVVAVMINDMLFSSDVQGPVSTKAAEWIIQQNPKTIIMDGPPTYFLGYRFSTESRDSAVENLRRIMEKTDVKEVILDHHSARDLTYRERFPVFDAAEELGVKIRTAAEHRGMENLFLEAWRRDIHKGVKHVDADVLRRVYDV